MWQFATTYPGFSFLIVCVMGLTATSMWTRAMRHLNIRSAGWPPEHCDADGDLIIELDVDGDE